MSEYIRTTCPRHLETADGDRIPIPARLRRFIEGLQWEAFADRLQQYHYTPLFGRWGYRLGLSGVNAERVDTLLSMLYMLAVDPDADGKIVPVCLAECLDPTEEDDEAAPEAENAPDSPRVPDAIRRAARGRGRGR